jgi:S-DNA-T family DNA segregation ATPase FtsK/SpoIIIE
MAKKKKRKETKKASSGYQIELVGILLILIAIIGICEFGIVGNFIKCFSAFLVGEHYNILLAGVAIIGIYMMIKREKPNFFTSNLIGLYILVLAILIVYHINYVKEFNLEGMEILKETINNLMSFSEGAKIYGGGILGALFSIAFVKLFSIEGTRVVCIVLIICGFIMFTGLSIYDMVRMLKNKTKNIVKHKDNKKPIHPI